MKKVLILGGGRSGKSASRVLVRQGYVPCIFDEKPLNKDEFPKNSLFYEDGSSTYDVHNFEFAVVSPGFPISHPLIMKLKSLGVHLVSELDFGYRNLLGRAVCITGTNGKSTTATLIADSLAMSGRKRILCGNIGRPITDVIEECDFCDVAVTEVSSFQLELTEQLRPHIAVLTNISEDHLDRHGSFSRYAELKFKLFQNMTKRDFAVLNADDNEVISRVDKVGASLITFSKNSAQSRGVYLREGEIFHTLLGKEERVCSLSEVSASVHIDSFLATFATSVLLGASSDNVLRAVNSFVLEKNTLTLVNTVDGVRFYNDSKGTNPASTEYAVSKMVGKCVLIAGGRNKGNSFDDMAALTKGKLSAVIAIGECAEEIIDAYKRQGYFDVVRARSLEEAVRIGYELCYPDGSVLFSPASASFDAYSSYVERGERFKKTVRMLNEK